MYNLETKLQKQFAKDHDKNFIVPNNCVTIIPWILKSGYRNVTEEGFKEFGVNPDYYAFFQKIFTGNESITAIWEDSTYLTKLENEYKFKYNFQVGKYYSGAPVIGTIEYGTDIEEVEGNEDYMAMKSSGTITVRVEGWVPTGEDLYKLYSIPDTPFKARWLYISSVKALNDLLWTEGFDTTNIPVCEITFTTLLDKLQTSGKAVEQYVQYAAPGEPYTFPVIVNKDINQPEPNPENEGQEPYVEPVKQVQNFVYNTNGIRYLQVEEQGLAATCAIQVVGRRLERDAQGNYISSPWKHLLFAGCTSPQLNDINKTSLPSKNYYYLPNESLMYRTSQDFQESIKLMNDAIATNHQAGQLTIGKTGDWTKTPQTGGYHKSNGINPTSSTHYDYNSIEWRPMKDVEETKQNIDTMGNPYSVSVMSINKNLDGFVDIMNKQSFVYATQEVLPLGYQNTKPYHFSVIPIIGKIAAKYYGDFSMNPNSSGKKPISLGCFIDCEATSLIGSIYNEGGQVDGRYSSPMLALAGDEAPKWLGTTACNSTFCFDLSDKLADGKDTIYLGQVRDENGNWLRTDHGTYLYENQKPVSIGEDATFIIDYVWVQSLFNGKIKVTCYDQQLNSMWTTTVFSKSHWTESLRDWTTEIKTGCWPEQFCKWNQGDWPWPENPSKDIYNNWSIGYEAKNIDNPKVGDDPSPYDWQKFTFSWVGGGISGWNPIYITDDYPSRRFEVRAPFDTYIHSDIPKWSGNDFCWVQNNGVSKTYETNYNQIDSSCSTKEQFLAKYEALQISFDGSILSSSKDWYDPESDPIDTHCDYSSKFNIDFVKFVGDTYSTTINVNSLGLNEGGPWLPPTNSTHRDNQEIRNDYVPMVGTAMLAWGDLWYEGGVTTRAYVTFQLKANSIQFTITDKTRLYKQNLLSRQHFNSGVLFRESMRYSIQVPKIDFLPKDAPKPAPTGYSILGGTEPLIIRTGGTGIDNKPWKLYLDGQVVSAASFSLEALHTGLGPFRLSSTADAAYIAWNAATTAGQYELTIVANTGTQQISHSFYAIVIE